MRIALLVVGFLSAFSSSSWAQEYWGVFGAGPSGEFRDASPWTEFVLDTDFEFEDPNGLNWVTPSGTVVNGASIPPAFWSLIGGPFSGRYIKASVIHDHYVRTRERTSHDTHRNFYYGMLANDVPKWKAKAMYFAVRTFGESWELRKDTRIELTCTKIEGGQECSAKPVTREVAEVNEGLDLNDLNVWAVAQAKVTAVARTLQTTDGEILDVFEGGEIAADLESIEARAGELRSALANYPGTVNPEVVGIMAAWSSKPLEDVGTWADGQLPTFADAPEEFPLFARGDSFSLPEGSPPDYTGIAQNFPDFQFDTAPFR